MNDVIGVLQPAIHWSQLSADDYPASLVTLSIALR